ncbi:MAG: transcriptional repressor LexA [Gemmataceae bacterium]
MDAIANETPANLTHKQQQIFDFILKTIQDRGFPPTIRDICKQFEIKSPNGVMCHLRALQKKGKIKRDENISRGITIDGVSAGGFSLPMLGHVAAGKAIESNEPQERLDMKELFGQDNLFALKVRGTSMIENQIADGDYVVIRKQEEADNGDKVVAMIDKAMTLKKFYKRKDHIKLEPANGTMEPIIVDPTRQDVSVLGKLVGVIRRCS